MTPPATRQPPSTPVRPSFGDAGAEAQPRWRASRLLDAPHRLGFFAGGLMWAASAAWWAALLGARALSWPVAWAVSPGLAHALLMTFGFTPLFFTGFLFTAGPKWLAQPEQPAQALLPTVAAALAGWALFVAGVHLSTALAAGGLALVALGWCVFVLRFVRLVRASRVADRTHARWVSVACGVGVVALWLAVAGLAASREDVARAAVQLGLWGFVALVFASVAHRMIPFFNDGGVPRLDVRRPSWLLWVFATTLGWEAAFGIGEALAGPLPAAARGAQAALEAPVAALLLWLALRWWIVPVRRAALRQPLPAMLYVGFAWFALALVMLAAAHGSVAIEDSAPPTAMLAPLHAMAIGFLGSTLLAMASRVTCGHSGRARVVDGVLRALFWSLQGAVLLRLAGAWWPVGPLSPALLALAALAWLAVAGGWAVRYGRWLGLPRADGRPH